MGQKVKVVPISKTFEDEIQSYVKECKIKGLQSPKLVGILATSDPAASSYAEWTGKAFLSDGLRYTLIRCPDPLHVESHLQALDADPDVSGIIVYYPCFGTQPSYSGVSMDDYLRDSVSPRKDVEGLCWTYRTALLEKCALDAEECVGRSDVVVLGVPVKSYKMASSWVKPGTVVVNVASFKNYEEDRIMDVEGVRVVGMVGKVTVKMLERNLCRLHKQYYSEGGGGDKVQDKIEETKKWAIVAAGMATVAAVAATVAARRGR
ncbi:hypothetical protein TrRE_jg3865 [Triparma retinervis]|uniref:Tetrahydrofolate dehydrogenase/cyclohydrolase catalytic domain-containing protein n=1 Tax=Triparma retinervis TaxID=2557542 RepID=A0A9W7ACK0_9STRA|nr:hypothetical protein TrRE_jg3865 [Triparma retinervis]